MIRLPGIKKGISPEITRGTSYRHKQEYKKKRRHQAVYKQPPPTSPTPRRLPEMVRQIKAETQGQKNRRRKLCKQIASLSARRYCTIKSSRFILTGRYGGGKSHDKDEYGADASDREYGCHRILFSVLPPP